ncbi:cellulose synthase complex periplasmic endoglucanase BcsZ [Acidipila rosea]|uniref:cellulase n=1 Tax=Acidipila rosea TaxID=768535 RepID=A0A4R1LDY0_9BACT|nr:cellulose synthase complex periplasmic endoglucanase BcsZ [Acidipila rosea]TCK75947.1 cellulase (glycosyl hydrolase family 8) [Acidipila rosea]
MEFRRKRSFRTVLLAAALLAAPISCLAQGWPLWQDYSSVFIDAQGRVVDHQAGDRTTSEGQSYGLFFSLVANDRQTFDKLLHWTQNNLAGGDLTARLPGWQWGRAGDGEWKLLDSHSAADSDLWIAYSLLEAGRLWQQPHYTAIGKALAARIASTEVADLPGFGPMLLPGETGFHPNADTWVLNPCYLPQPLIARMAAVDPQGPWRRLAADLPRFLSQSASHGFAMDWVTYRPGEGFRPAPAPGQFAAPTGSYDAIRVYLWAGITAPAAPGRAAVLESLSGMAAYLRSHPLPPEKVNPDGSILSANGPVGFSAATVPFLQALGLQNALRRQQSRLSQEKNPSTGLFGQQPTYYDQNLAMFGRGWATQRFSFSPDGELNVKWKRL